MKRLLIVCVSVFLTVNACVLKKEKPLPRSIEIGRTYETEPIFLNSNEKPVPVEMAPTSERPLTQKLVLYRIQPSEMSNHVPIRTNMAAIGEPLSSDGLGVLAYPSPADITDKITPIPLNGGYFLDRSGFIGAGTRFLDIHYDEYKNIEFNKLSDVWFIEHVISTDAMQFEWLVCDCDKGDDSSNAKILNSMISKGIDKFRHPEVSTQIHPKFGSVLPQTPVNR